MGRPVDDDAFHQGVLVGVLSLWRAYDDDVLLAIRAYHVILCRDPADLRRRGDGSTDLHAGHLADLEATPGSHDDLYVIAREVRHASGPQQPPLVQTSRLVVTWVSAASASWSAAILGSTSTVTVGGSAAILAFLVK